LDAELQSRFVIAELAAEKSLPMRRLGATPRKFYREHRREISAAALALLGRYIAAGAERISSDQPGLEFQSWDELVRQCVLWLARSGIAELGDPVANSFPR
jgi:hypothetical protein